ncbi:MAG: SDR family NAD(P)-dependent oxidoreductase [Actinomycetia bacterium]|nr:SDR family NAD(P)-dependent oxidoreductase [Actinomycetes bacterium]
MVELLAAQEIPTVVVARRRDRLDELAARHSCVTVLAADLTEPEGLRTVVERVADIVDTIDLVVNNAGFGTSGEFYELDADRLDREVQLNVAALTRISRAALGVMVPRGRGYLLNVSSVASFQSAPKLAVYAATKAYVTSFSESIHEEVRGKGVHVTALCPGLTRTEFQSVSSTERYASEYPSFAWMESDEVARAGLIDVAKGKTLSIPGGLYKGLVATTGFVPRSLMRRLSSLVQRD